MIIIAIIAVALLFLWLIGALTWQFALLALGVAVIVYLITELPIDRKRP